MEGSKPLSGQDRFISDEEWERRERDAARVLGQLPQVELGEPGAVTRARCPQCGRDSVVMANGFLMSHGPADQITGIRACHHVKAPAAVAS